MGFREVGKELYLVGVVLFCFIFLFVEDNFYLGDFMRFLVYMFLGFIFIVIVIEGIGDLWYCGVDFVWFDLVVDVVFVFICFN